MAEDFHDKTEEPTPKKLADARKKGFVAKSTDLTIALMLLGTVIIFFFFGPFMYSKIASLSFLILNHLNDDFADLNLVSSFLNGGLLQLFWLLFPLISGVAFMAILFNLLQTGLIFSTYPLRPKWKKLNVFDPANYEKNFGGPAAMRLFFGLVRLNLVLLLSWMISSADAFVIFTMGRGSPRDIGFYIYRQSLIVGTAYAISYVIVGILDFLYQKWRFMRQMRMSRREVKDELKQIEGDQTVKNKIKTMMQAFSGYSLAASIPKADVIITYGDKYVVAILFRQGQMKAPICLGKGSRKKGEVILGMAQRYHVPIVERPLLAKKLFYGIDNGTYVTPEFYHDLALILSQLQK